MDQLKSYLPQSEGYLPSWMLFVSVLAGFNMVQNYTTTKLTRRVYGNAGTSVNPLQSRCFGLWTFTSGLVRYYAAYNINDKQWYHLALATYMIVVAHYASELFIYRTAKLNAGFLSPAVVGSLSLFWMTSQYDFYLN